MTGTGSSMDTSTSHACDLCGSSDRTELRQAARFGSGGVFVCNDCGFVYVPIRRTQEELNAFWTAAYSNGIYSARWPAVQARLEYVKCWYGEKFGWRGKRVFEIGAGEGVFLDKIRLLAMSAYGCEPAFIGGALPGWTDQTIPEMDKFDVVAILWTLENTLDCVGVLKKAREMLKPDGHLLVATGSRLMVPFKKPIELYFSQNPPDTHCYRFSGSSLENALHQGGFSEVRNNPYREQDWLVIVGRPYDGAMGDVQAEPANSVLRFFDEWEACQW